MGESEATLVKLCIFIGLVIALFLLYVALTSKPSQAPYCPQFTIPQYQAPSGHGLVPPPPPY